MAEASADEPAADLVTKQDLTTAADLRAEMQAVRAEIHQRSGALIRWFAGLLLIQAGLVVGLIRFLQRSRAARDSQPGVTSPPDARAER